MISRDQELTTGEFCAEMYKMMSKIHIVNLALKEEEGSDLAVRCSTVLDEIDKEFQSLNTAINENRIKGLE